MKPRKHTTIAHLMALFILGSCIPALSQDAPLATKDYILWAQEFLRAVYPDLSGKKYVLTLEAYLEYDKPGLPARWLKMDVGEGPKDWRKGYIGGCTNEIVPPQLPWPPELGPPPDPAPASPRPAPPPSEQLRQLLKRHQENCPMGPVYPTQFLTAAFVFDKEGRLASFTANGPAINDGEANNAVYEVVRSHPEVTDAEIASLLKQSGTRYGPDDKEEFIKNLPLKQLQPFLGNLELMSVRYPPLGHDRVTLSMWPCWIVDVFATQKDGTKLRYRMTFDRLKGNLSTIGIVAAS